MSEIRTIGFIGLGVMGAPMAAHLVRAGYAVTAYNRTASRAKAWKAALADEGHTASTAATPAQAASGKDLVLSCVGNDDDLAQVLFGAKGALAHMRDGSLLVDHTTVSADMSRRIDREATRLNIAAVDAPVSGGQAGAENGKLAVMCGGTTAAVEQARPVLEAFSARIVHVGDAGAGQTTKMANQMCIAGTLAGLSEAVRLSSASGLDMDKVLEAISGGAAQSWQMENRWATMASGDFDFGFAIDWMRKDLGYALGEAQRLGLSSPVTALVDQFYAEVQAMGGARQDTSALIRRLPEGNDTA
ncbi:NAD(P)-dependent oxidoreductase [Parerythrobacter jejuensis]|uniref:NAD-binding protein n=1 Tax=Parerythrobacter jejuensis TaxID=795812 RepID=A0A845ARZ5_9SPHN|nr:NAD(P)-dependent oxidoreductase [Parerythrobacter jejuensis]MXP31611.1 NAD-binding protein [Parerythrobacter jejuensis]